MFDEGISGEVPEHREFIYDIAIPKLEDWGVKVVILRSENTYVSSFMRTIRRGAKIGQIKGFPLCGHCNIQRDCKTSPLNKYKRELGENAVQYIGIAANEQSRLLRLGENRISLLEKYGKTEADAVEIVKAKGLLSPIYEFASRNGCFFCPNAKPRELRHLYDHHKDLWELMLTLQAVPNKATELFNRTQKFSDIDNDFQMQDAQIHTSSKTMRR